MIITDEELMDWIRSFPLTEETLKSRDIANCYSKPITKKR